MQKSDATLVVSHQQIALNVANHAVLLMTPRQARALAANLLDFALLAEHLAPRDRLAEEVFTTVQPTPPSVN